MPAKCGDLKSGCTLKPGCGILWWSQKIEIGQCAWRSRLISVLVVQAQIERLQRRSRVGMSRTAALGIELIIGAIMCDRSIDIIFFASLQLR